MGGCVKVKGNPNCLVFPVRDLYWGRQREWANIQYSPLLLVELQRYYKGFSKAHVPREFICLLGMNAFYVDVIRELLVMVYFTIQ